MKLTRVASASPGEVASKSEVTGTLGGPGGEGRVPASPRGSVGRIPDCGAEGGWHGGGKGRSHTLT